MHSGARALTALAVAAAVAAPLWRAATKPTPLARVRALAQRAPFRAIEGRLAGHPYAPLAPALRSQPQDSDRAMLPLRAEAARAMQNGIESDPHAYAVLRLLTGDASTAAERLRALTESAVGAETWNDYSAASLQVASATRNPEWLATSLAAADRALDLDTHNLEAHFNRALALEKIGLVSHARNAYERYLQLDGTSEWSMEARARISQLPRGHAEQWTAALKELRTAVRSGDTDVIARVVNEFPQQARTWSEVVFLGDWAAAMEASDDARAADELLLARTIGDTLLLQSGESLLHDACSAIQQASATGSERRLRALVSGHRVYQRARIAYGKRLVGEAIPQFDEAARLFQNGGTPMDLVARYYAASAWYDANDGARARRELESLLTVIPQQYIALRAQALWQTGTVVANAGGVYEALQAYTGAFTHFQQLGERENATRMRVMTARILQTLGRNSEAWRWRSEAFEATSASGDESLLEQTLGESGLDELQASRWNTARSFFALALDATATPNPRRRFDALLWHTLTAWRLGVHNDAENDAGLHAALAKIEDPTLRENARHDLQTARAIMVGRNDPERASLLLTQAITYATAHDKRMTLALLHLERARAYRQLGRDDDALTDLETARDELETRRRNIAAIDLRDAFFSTSANVFAELVAAYSRRGEHGRAFLTTETARGRTILDRIGRTTSTSRTSVADLSKSIPAHHLLVSYFSLDERLILFLVSNRGMRVVHVPVDKEELVRTVGALSEAVAAGDDQRSREAAGALHRWLIAPLGHELTAARHVVFVPDPYLGVIPFSALYDGQRNRYFAQDFAYSIAPSASVLKAALDRGEPVPAGLSVVAVGDPAFDAGVFRDIPRLPAARNEAEAIAHLYGGSSATLCGTDATFTELTRHIAAARVVHIATHAIVNASDAARSALLFARDGSSGAVYLPQLSHLPLRSDALAFLSGCGTARLSARDTDTSNFALALLSAGARNVVGTSWDVEDDLAKDFALRFHRALVAGRPPSEALREAQLQMFASTNPRLRNLRAWSGFQVFGTGQ